MSQLFILSSAKRTSLFRQIVWPPPARRALVLLAMGLAAVASVVAGPAAPASAAVTFTASSFNLALNLPLPDTLPVHAGPEYYPINLPTTLFAPPYYQQAPNVNPDTFYMQAGEHRRVSEQLDVSLTHGNGAEMDNQILCLDPNGNILNQDRMDKRASAGTNNLGTAGQHFVWRLSMLITANMTGEYTCGILVQTNTGDPSQDDYTMTVWPVESDDASNGTWMQVSTVDQAGAQQFDYAAFNGGVCTPADNPSPGSGDATHLPDAPCHYVGGVGYVNRIAVSGPINPPVADILNDPVGDRWTAASDAFNVDAIGTLQLTSCPYGSSSCRPAEWGYTTVANVSTYLDLDQLNPDGSVCQVNRAYGWSLEQTTENLAITNDTHHQPISYEVTAPVSPCGGSRVFQLDLRVQWLGGNAIKIDGGNVNVINSVRGTTTPATTTVPGVVRDTETQADGAIQAAGLSVETTYAVSTRPVNTVLSQSPAVGTTVQVGSPVQIVVSLGHPVQ